jgi:hypothetical protein
MPKKHKTRKQKVWNMKGCSKKKGCKKSSTKKNKLFYLGKCNKCGPNCRCGPNCNCPHKCPGNCYLNKKILKGGMGCGNTTCPIASYSMMRGGKKHKRECICSLCSKRGGNFYKPASSIPGPFVGEPWTPKVSNWPGVDGVSSNRNYLDQNLYKNDPQTMMKLKSGGGIIPQELINLGRGLGHTVQSAYNVLNGYEIPPSPLPYKDQLVLRR